MSFPSIFYKQVPDDGAIAGALPTCLYIENSTHGFASINKHMKIRLLSSGAATSTSPAYISFAYDTILNLATNHSDTRMVINRAVPEPIGKFGVSLKENNDGQLTDSIDSRRNVQNLCASQLYHHMHFFKTLTVNQRMHFGISPLKQWTDSDEWKNNFDWNNLTSERQDELCNAISQASATLTLRNWLEVRKLFVDWLIGSEDSPYAPVDAVFVRDEFQDKRGNLPHIHMLISIDFDKATDAQKKRIEDLIRADIGSIVRSDEVEFLIEDGILTSMEDWKDLQDLSDEILPHRCTARCLVRIKIGDGPESFRCKSNNNLRLSQDVTRDNLIPLPMNLSIPCIERLIRCGLLQPIEDLTDFSPEEFIGHHPFLYPKKHVPKLLVRYLLFVFSLLMSNSFFTQYKQLSNNNISLLPFYLYKFISVRCLKTYLQWKAIHLSHVDQCRMCNVLFNVMVAAHIVTSMLSRSIIKIMLYVCLELKKMI